jgi:hypothetical protein
MKQEIKDKWVAALRSEEYEQGKHHLKNDDKFCCLGVLCDIHSKETGTEWVKHNYLKHGAYLPKIVMSWSGLKKAIPIVNVDKIKKDLAELNDSGSTFLKIADLIEEQL